MKTLVAYNAYITLKGLKMNEASDETLTKLWENILALAPVSEELEKAEKIAKESLEDEEFKKMQERGQRLHGKMTKQGMKETPEDVIEGDELRKYFDAHNKKGEEFFAKTHDKEVKISLPKLQFYARYLSYILDLIQKRGNSQHYFVL